MKKVIRLTESDLIRLVKRVISEQDLQPQQDLESQTDHLNELESEVKDLAKQITSVRQENFQGKKEELKERIIEIYGSVIAFFEKVISKLKAKTLQVKNDVRKKALMMKIKKMEDKRDDLIKKRDELKRSGDVLTQGEKVFLIGALSMASGLIFTGAATNIVKTLFNMISGGRVGF